MRTLKQALEVLRLLVVWIIEYKISDADMEEGHQ
jgi:hypothetical protein